MLIVPLDILAGICFFIFEPLASMLFQLNDLVVALLSLIFQGIETVLHHGYIPCRCLQWYMSVFV